MFQVGNKNAMLTYCYFDYRDILWLNSKHIKKQLQPEKPSMVLIFLARLSMLIGVLLKVPKGKWALKYDSQCCDL